MKYDTLTKHVGLCWATQNFVSLAKKGEYFYSKDCIYAKYVVLYIHWNSKNVHDMVQNELGVYNCKWVQFATIFYILISRGVVYTWIWKSQSFS